MDEKQIYQVARLILEERGVDASHVLAQAIYPDRVALVLDHGSQGCPKHTVPMAEILAHEPVEQDATGVDAQDGAQPAAGGVDLLDDPFGLALFGVSAWPEPAVDATQMAIVEARQLGIDLGDIRGTGQGGRVTVTDVRRRAAR